MSGIEDIVRQMRTNPKGIRFKELRQVCDAVFGNPGTSSTSHRVYNTPWPGDPRVNIQNKRGMAKPYQVKQVLRAIELLEVERDTGE